MKMEFPLFISVVAESLCLGYTQESVQTAISLLILMCILVLNTQDFFLKTVILCLHNKLFLNGKQKRINFIFIETHPYFYLQGLLSNCYAVK
jgi:hypothetical protein